MKSQKLALLLEQGQITVSLWTFGFKGWGIARTEKVVLPTADPLAEQVLAAIRPLVLKWAIAPDTPVLTVVPAGVGGFLSLSLSASAAKDLDALIDVEIAKALPFSVREVEKSHSVVKDKDQLRVSVLWMPRSWVGELKNALARIGLRLSELFHRAQLVGGELGGSGELASAPWGCIEQDGKAVHFHFFRQGGVVERSRSLTSVEAPRLAQELNLDLLSLSCIGLAPRSLYLAGVDAPLGEALAANPGSERSRLKAHRREQALPGLLLAYWRRGGAGVWLMPERTAMMARLTPWTIGLVAAFMVTAGVLWWTVLDQRSQTEQLDADIKKIKQKFQKASAVESEVIRFQREINAIQEASRPAEALDALHEVFKALPEQSWLVGFRFDGKEVAVEGYGTSEDDVRKALGSSPRLAGIETREAQLAVDAAQHPFALKMKWKAAPPAPATTK